MTDTKQEIMEATCRAFHKYSYPELSIQKIAEEFDKGKSLIYYHFDDKDELMLSCLKFLNQQLEEVLDDLGDKETDERIEKLLDLFLDDSEPGWEFHKVIIGMRAEAAYEEAFREEFNEIDQKIKKEIIDILEKKGSANPEIQAELILSAIAGTVTRKITSGSIEDMDETRSRIRELFD